MPSFPFHVFSQKFPNCAEWMVSGKNDGYTETKDIAFYKKKMRPEIERMGLPKDLGDVNICWKRLPNGWIKIWWEKI